MTKNTNSFLQDRIVYVHARLLDAGNRVSTEQFAQTFSDVAPPIGWHLWHMARFADRLQSKLAVITEGTQVPEIWYRDNIGASWHLLPEDLGVFVSGMGQGHAEPQATITQVGQAAISAYASSVFAACDEAVKKLADTDFDKTYHGLLDYGYDAATGKVWATAPKESTVGQDLIFHATHGSRHMGMMEALRGLLGTAGTLSV